MLVKNKTNQAELETHQTSPALVEKKSTHELQKNKIAQETTKKREKHPRQKEKQRKSKIFLIFFFFYLHIKYF